MVIFLCWMLLNKAYIKSQCFFFLTKYYAWVKNKLKIQKENPTSSHHYIYPHSYFCAHLCCSSLIL